MTIKRFEDIVVWKEARKLTKDIYAAFRQNPDRGFRDQIQRAAVSIMNNIAEGFDRSKFSKDNKQLISFLNIANGSCGEVKSMLYLAQDLEYLSLGDAEFLRDKCMNISLKMNGLLKTLQDNNGQNNRELIN
ncbi:MAG: four helix bundle protein [Paludibacteraceae bacterium]|nr:four helix bundle protein [Paludibacteraceae bacterium]